MDGNAFEQTKWEEEKALRNRELEIREKEAQATIKAQETSRWTNPLVLAVLAATLAGIGNLAVAWKTGSDQFDLTKSKNNEEREIEETKAESARILEVVKVSDPDRAAQNLAFLLDSGLITNEARIAKLTAYLQKRKGGQGVGIQVAAASTLPPASGPNNGKPENPDAEKPQPPQIATETSDAGSIFKFSTGWIGGGHTQAEACAQAMNTAKAQTPNRNFKVIHSSEESNKDFFGHVTYNYTCILGPS
jgi:hypothetical protein